MPSELFDALNLKGDAWGLIGGWLSDFGERLMRSADVRWAVGFILSLVESMPLVLSVILLLISTVILLFPSAVAKPIGVLYSAALGFALTAAYLPVDASEEIPVTVLAVIVAIVFTIANRLVSLISYFAAVGIFAYIGAFSGMLSGFGEGDIFLSLVISAAVILASLITLLAMRIAGICFFGGCTVSLSLSLLVDFALIFGGAAGAVTLGISAFLALLGIRRYLKRRGKNKSAEQST